MSQSTALTIPQRASAALGAAEHEKKLVALAKQSTEITTITNADGYRQCHAARMVLKNERIDLEKIGKAARDDATKFSKAVIAEENRLIALIRPEEERLAAIQAEWDAIEERKRQAEALRISKLQERIEAIKSVPLTVAGKSAAAIADVLANTIALPLSDFEEFTDFAKEARGAAVATLEQLHAGAVAQEKAAAEIAEKARQDAEELARLRAAEELRKKEEQARLDAEAKERAKAEADARARIEAEESAARARIAAEEAEARARRESEEKVALERRQREEAEARQVAEAQAAEEARLKAERDALEAEQREVERQRTELLDGRAVLESFITRFGKRREFSTVVRVIHEFLVGEKKAA